MRLRLKRDQQQQQQEQLQWNWPQATTSSIAPLFSSPPSDIHLGDGSSTGRGVLIGILSAFGSAAFVALLFAIIYFFKFTPRGRIILDALGRPGEYDDEVTRAREEAEALEQMDEISQQEYLRAKGIDSARARIRRKEG